jgi:hypothetical protein
VYWNYFRHGIDVQFDGISNAVAAVVFHSNLPGFVLWRRLLYQLLFLSLLLCRHPGFGRYNKCPFEVSLLAPTDGLTASALQEASPVATFSGDVLWSDVEAAYGAGGCVGLATY